MSTYYSPKIVTNGLIMHLDAANPKSYPGSGVTWYDICGNYNGTLVSSPTFTGDNGGVVNLTSAGARVTVSGINLSSGTHTVMAASRYNVGGTHGRIVSSINNNWLLGHWAAYTDDHYAEGWVQYATTDISSNWFIYTSTGDSVADNWKFYINAVKKADNNGGSQGPNGIQIGGYGGTNEFTDGQCAFVMAYSRVLTDSEILQNYNAMKSRFAL